MSRATHPLVEVARGFVDEIRAGAAEAAERCDLPEDLVARMAGSGLFRMLQPARWGGGETGLGAMLEVQNVLAEGSASAAWLHGVFSVQASVLGQIAEEAQAELWGEDGATLASSSFMPVGRAEPVAGGYRLSGRWSFSSGSVHGRWAVLGALAPAGEGRVMTLFLLPRADYAIDRVWQPFGLRATGSHDIVVDDAFVPAHRAWPVGGGLVPERYGARGVGPLYTLPWRYVFSASVSNLGIGVLRRALHDFLGIARERRSLMAAGATRDDPLVQADVAAAAEAIRGGEAMFARHLARFDAVSAGAEEMDEAEGQIVRYELTGLMRRLAETLDRLQRHLGARGLAMTSPLVGPWLDLQAARVHPGNDPGPAGLAGARALLDAWSPAALHGR